MGAAVDNIRYDYSSMRSEKARISVMFNKNRLTLLSILVVLLLGLGVVMLMFESSIGWAFVGLSTIPAMVVEWYNGELKHIPVIKNPKTIDDLLSGEVLGRLSKKPSPREVATIVSQLPGGYFFAVRFGIGSKFLQELTSTDDRDMQRVWVQALDLQKKTNSKNISAAILIVAIIRSTSNYQTLISHLQLDDGDLMRGIDWYNHLRVLIERHRAPRRTGGIARDWSFGWTPMLNRFGLQMGVAGESLFQLIAHEESLNQLMGIFSKNGRQNVVLVGQPGVGKTEIVNAFAARLMDGSVKVPNNLRFRQVYNLDAASLIAAAPDRGGLESLIPQVLGEAYSAKNVIICLDNAQLFFEDGIGSVDITNVLLPILKAGNLRMILTVDEQRFLQISKRNPELANALNRIVVPPAERDDTIRIMQDQTVMIEFQNNVTFMYQSLVEAYRLGDRYVHDQAMPGKAIKLLESSANYSDNGLVSAESVRQAIEKTMDIKVSVATDADEREKLLNLEELIHGRMINQVRAVNVVSDALRRARAGVRNLNRPIGTFLFLGPTGVGKTELAKSLAEIYFKGEDRIVRIDMNEYVSSSDVSRLIADGADNANSLTAQVMKQPFSVILLDEIEKAHTNVMSTLLQMLDEGILRDIKNREVSFRDAIIVATSNAGADRIREYIDRGYDIEQFEDKFVDELISSNQFRPEFLNRFDEIVMFRPLNKPELLKVVDLMITGVNKTLALQKVSVDVALEAKEYLVAAGYDPRLGARPMRRVVQRAVENTVAKQMLSGTVEPGSVIEISLEQVKQIIDSKATADKIVEEEKVV
ncbi:MAG TPA: ATP-dependent Clp protease ATP-binding subunit [Candidatus Saccharimonadales bacterium]|nr:ATP-dependent Clp protease ATP-binding subunit [Candidatus Saccharimonadales bacterium]